MRSLTSAILLFLLLQNCDSARVYERFIDLEDTWHQDSSLQFSITAPDDSNFYNLIAHFTIDNSYPYYNLYFNFTLRREDSLINSELKEIVLFNPKTGYPLGAGSGNKFDHKLMLKEKFSFDTTADYSISLSQFMRVTELPNIYRVGVRLERVQDN